MTNEEYFRQAYRLDQKIQSDIEEVSRLRAMAVSISAPVAGDRVQTSLPSDAPFAKCVEKILLLEEKINAEIDAYVGLKEQIRDAIAAVSDTDEQMVLRSRYIHNKTWEQIGRELNANARTIRRWHEEAILHVSLPKNPIII